MEEVEFAEPLLVGEGFSGWVELDDVEGADHPVVGDERGVELGGESWFCFWEVFFVEDGASASGGMWVVPECGLGGGQLGEAGIVDGFVQGGGRSEFGAKFFGDEVVVGVGLVVGDEVGPSEVSCGFGLVDFVVSPWAAWGVFTGVGADFSPVEEVGFLVDRDAIGVAAAHDVDFGAGEVGSGRKEVSFGDGV